MEELEPQITQITQMEEIGEICGSKKKIDITILQLYINFIYS